MFASHSYFPFMSKQWIAGGFAGTQAAPTPLSAPRHQGSFLKDIPHLRLAKRSHPPLQAWAGIQRTMESGGFSRLSEGLTQLDIAEPRWV